MFDICAKISRNLSLLNVKLIEGYMRGFFNFNRKHILGGLGAEPSRKFLIFALKLVEISWYVKC